MLTSHFSAYLGSEKEHGFAGFIAEEGFYGVLSAEDGFDKEDGREILKKIAAEMLEKTPRTVAEFETFLTDQLKLANLPLDFSLACGYVSQKDKIILSTNGQGQIFIKRGGKTAKIIDGTKNASGYVENNDLLILTTHRLQESFGDEQSFMSFVAKQDMSSVVDEIILKMKEQDDSGSIALFISFAPAKEPVSVLQEDTEDIKDEREFIGRSYAFFERIIRPLLQEKKKAVTFVAVGALFFIFLWSVILGYQRRVNEKQIKEISYAKDLITGKLSQAEDVVFLNQGRAVALINESKSDLANLKKQVSDKNNKEIKNLEELIVEKENRILKKEEKKPVEFYDLSLEDKQASGDLMYQEGGSAAILDKKGTVYVLSLEKKSIDSRDIGDASAVAAVSLQNDDVFFYKKNSGIFRVDAEGKIKKVIDNDHDWGAITALANYNNNLYVLDTSKNNIYKYVPTESEFSEKSSYFKSGQQINIRDAASFVIDGSVYIALDRRILKFTSGLQDGFAPVFPEEKTQITKVLTTKDIEKLYAWDKNRAAIYVVNKSGDYERQIQSSVLARANDVVVQGTKAYILAKQKIYVISLE